jgi:hypothetical protein
MINAVRRAVVAIVAACGGSHAHPPDAVPDAGVDAAMISAHDVVRDLRDDMQALPIVDERPYNSLVASVRQPDGTWTPVAVAADGTFSFAADGSYRLQLAADGGRPLELQLAAPHLDLAGSVGARYDRAPVPAGTQLAVTLGNPSSTGVSGIASTGVWAGTTRQNGTNASFVVDWTQIASGLLDTSAYDKLYGLTYDSVDNPAFTTITGACSSDVTMTGGAATAAGCTLAPLVRDHCVHIVAHVAAEDARIVAALAGAPAFSTAVYAWNIDAVPAPSLGPVGLLSIAGYGVNATPTADIDRDLTMYAVPFLGHAPMVIMSVVRQRTTAAGLTLSAYTQHYVQPAPDCATPTDIPGTAAIAGVPTLDGVALASDNVEIALDPTRDHELAWPVASGTADLWVVNLYTVTGAQLAYQRAWLTADPHVAIDAAQLPAGASYLFHIRGVLGAPNVRTGDLRTISYPAAPYADSVVPSAIFEVTN